MVKFFPVHHFLALLLVLLMGFWPVALHSQPFMLQQPSPYEIARAPLWAQKMYAGNVSVDAVDSLYRAYYRIHPFEKSYHTQYYKRWRRFMSPFVAGDGFIHLPPTDSLLQQQQRYEQLLRTMAKSRNIHWSLIGPLEVFDPDSNASTDHVNVYCIDQSQSDPLVMYCGTEPGEVYKSTDGGQSWEVVSRPYSFYGGVTAIAIDPFNPDIVLAGGSLLRKSTDGGNTWITVLTDNDFYANEILINPSDPQHILVASNSGLYRSADGGNNFTTIFTEAVYDLKLQPGNEAVVYMAKNNPALIRSEFFKSADYGATWTLKDQGWYLSTDPDRADYGCRLAVSAADPNRVYAYLIGEAKAGDIGFIGVYRSNDAGESWFLPNGPPGGPYSNSHPNLARGWAGWDYHQGFYNCALLASHTDADKLLIGGLNLWRSDDGGYTFSPVGGYLQGTLNLHPDVQDLRETSSGTWMTNDGGIMVSYDFFTNEKIHRSYGVHGTDYWGFGLGWNEKVMVGGAYHNGNIARVDPYPAGAFLSLGGGEAPTGYVNPGRQRTVYCSDIGMAVLPEQIGSGPVFYGALALAPNESYWPAESGEMEFWPYCYNHLLLGYENKLWRSEDGGSSFQLVKAFGTNANARVQHMEISRSNPSIVYVSMASAGSSGSLWKTTDSMATWQQLTLPAVSGSTKRILLALSPVSADSLWLAFPGGANGYKVFRTTDGGLSWQNLTTAVLNDQEVRCLLHQQGSNGGIYLFTRLAVWYRNNSMTDWQLINDGLPAYAEFNIARPFYRDGKIVAATYGKGVFESDFYEPFQGKPVAQPTVDKLLSWCGNDTFYFNDYSILNHQNAAWQWTFENGIPATSALRNPQVVFMASGKATLTVTDAAGLSDTRSLNITLLQQFPAALSETFENNFPPYGWISGGLNGGVNSWNKAADVGGYGLSPSSAFADNYNFDLTGTYGDLRAFVDLSGMAAPLLTFDVAYAQYSNQYSDTLEVLASSDCGLTALSLYQRGGDDLATAPDFKASRFVPKPNQWRTDTIDLSSFAGQPNVTLIFRNHGRYGQAMYLDNVNLQPALSAPPAEQPYFAQLIPSLASRESGVMLSTNLSGTFRLALFDASGTILRQENIEKNHILSLANLSAGTYYYRLQGEQVLRFGRLVVQ